MSRLFAAGRSLVYATLFLGFWGWLAFRARSADRLIGIALPPGAEVAGWSLLLLGGAVVSLCVGSFVMRGRGTPAPFDPPRAFVAVGPYRWVRNPMYLGALTMLVGLGLWQRSVAMLVFAGLVAGLAHAFVVLYEEPQLSRRFGPRYLAYRKQVNRWVPRAPGRRVRG